MIQPRAGVINGRFILLLGLLCFGISSLRALLAVEPDSLLAVVRSLYESGSFVSAELEARRLLDEPGITDSLAIAAEEYVAFSLIAQGKNAPATEYFVSILRRDSSYALDPLMTSPKIISVFSEARGRYARERSAVVTPVVTPPPPVPPGPSFRLIVFPGWDQLHQDRTTKGTILLSAGAISLGSLVTFDILRRSAREDYLAASTPAEAAARYRDYDRYYKAEYYSAAAFAVVYLYSAFDAFFDLPPRIDAAASPDGPGMQLSVLIPF